MCYSTLNKAITFFQMNCMVKKITEIFTFGWRLILILDLISLLPCVFFNSFCKLSTCVDVWAISSKVKKDCILLFFLKYAIKYQHLYRNWSNSKHFHCYLISQITFSAMQSWCSLKTVLLWIFYLVGPANFYLMFVIFRSWERVMLFIQRYLKTFWCYDLCWSSNYA